MTAVVILILIALILIVAEVFVPGGIIGLISVIFLVASWAVAYQTFGSSGAAITGAVSIALAVVTFILSLKIMGQSKLGAGLRLKSQITGTSNTPLYATDLIGKNGHTITKCVPSGSVIVDGKRYTAHSEDGFIDKDAAVIVSHVRGVILHVRKVQS